MEYTKEVVYTKERVRKYVGQWVHCHSVYGMHAGVLHRALHDGIVLVHHTALASGSAADEGDYEAGVFQQGISPEDYSQAQFFLPAPGMFVPYGGIYGLWPRPGFII